MRRRRLEDRKGSDHESHHITNPYPCPTVPFETHTSIIHDPSCPSVRPEGKEKPSIYKQYHDPTRSSPSTQKRINITPIPNDPDRNRLYPNLSPCGNNERTNDSPDSRAGFPAQLAFPELGMEKETPGCDADGLFGNCVVEC